MQLNDFFLWSWFSGVFGRVYRAPAHLLPFLLSCSLHLLTQIHLYAQSTSRCYVSETRNLSNNGFHCIQRGSKPQFAPVYRHEQKLVRGNCSLYIVENQIKSLAVCPIYPTGSFKIHILKSAAQKHEIAHFNIHTVDLNQPLSLLCLSLSQSSLCLSYLPLCEEADRNYLCASFLLWDHAAQDNSQGEDTALLFMLRSSITSVLFFTLPAVVILSLAFGLGNDF